MNALGEPMKTVWMLILAFFSYPLAASDFTHIKLTPEFEKALKTGIAPASTSKEIVAKLRARSSRSKILLNEMNLNLMIRTKLLGADISRDSKSLTSPMDGEESPLLEEIRQQLELSHQGLGAEQVTNLNNLNQQFNMGSQNFSGFTWQKPFGTVDIHVDRQVTPPAMVDDWMVRDTFTITVKATTFLEKLKEAGLSTMSGVEIGAFAGITFQRVYTYDHFAKSYNEGLAADYGKLFLPFLMFNQRGMNSMHPHEVMKKEDLWTAKAGAIISSPPMYGFSVSGGVLASADLAQSVSVGRSASNSVNDRRFNVGVLSKKAVTAGATASLQVDFFKLMQLTLMRFDLSYTYSSGKEYALGVTGAQYQKILANPEEKSEFNKILTGFGEVKLLEPYTVLLDEREEEKLETHGSILLWGRTKKTGSEIVRTIKDGNVKIFHKNYTRSIKYVQNLLSRLYSALFYSLLKLPIGVQNTAIYEKEVVMEYEVNHPQASDPELIRINGTEEFSFDLNQSYEANGTTKKSQKRYKADVMWFVDEFTALPKSIVTAFANDELIGPVNVESTLKVGNAGFKYFINRPLGEFFAQLAKVCESNKTDEWVSDEKRPQMLKSKQSGKEKCVQSLGSNVMDFHADYQANFFKPSIAKFSKFLKAYYKLTDNVGDLIALFGAENTFLMGKIQATSPIGTNFVQTFSNGQYHGSGVIEDYMLSAKKTRAGLR
jgi:hypothetical protein